MLYDQQGKQIHIPHNKEISENLRRSLRETKEVLDHKDTKDSPSKIVPELNNK